MEAYDRQLEAWLEVERAAIRAELQLKRQDQTESAPERIAKLNAAAKLRQEAEALLNEILAGPREPRSS
mgnify:CR=1 FL=1